VSSRRNSQVHVERVAAHRDQIRKRIVYTGTSFIVVFVFLASLLVYFQVGRNPKDVLGGVQSSMHTVPIHAVRGNITDRNGVLLAVTVDARNVVADQTLVTDPRGEAIKLANLLDLDAATIAERLTGTRRFVYIAKNITPTQWNQIDSLSLPGIFSERSQTRSYPEGTLGANFLGFVNSTGVGMGGLELQFNKTMSGIDGVRTFSAVAGVTTADQQVTPAVDGNHVQLTIDRDIQFVAQDAIATAVKKARAQSGSVVVMNAKTGEILAMATVPTFDPNNLRSAKSNNLGNRILADVYEPGSTGKVMTLAAVLEAGTMKPDSHLTVPGRLKRGDKKFKDAHAHKTEHLTLTGVLAKSSNIGSILAAETLSKQNLYDMLKKFGVAEKSGLGFPAESAGKLIDPNSWSVTTQPTVAFGQGYSMNVLQATQVFATIANNGIRMPAKLVAGFTDSSGRFQGAPDDRQPVQAISAKTASTLRSMMETVVSTDGTAPLARIPGYRVAGKTGTAQAFDASCGCYRGYVASFIGMAPADAPEIVVAVTLVQPRNGYYGGTLAAPVFKTVMSYALQQLRIPPTGSKPKKMKLTW
jgi:cell division protein FtsI (penicillin-binding protein 3)